ncbi:unnamed protein product [Gordionus sp. m RMFG-2023]|uniref:kelch-like protein diablo n=1 Tax=Gordionus sp. m RMFG-2023 TaxID=3053472 RepID=UPI0030E53CA0
MGDIVKGHPNMSINSEYSASCNKIMHVANKYPKHIMTQLNTLRQRTELCDLIIKVNSKSFFAHRAVLSAASPYFYAMFTGAMSESRESEITLHEISETALEQIINFVYTSTILIEESNVQALLPIACLFQMTDVQEACCDFLRKQLEPANCLGIRAFADIHSCHELHDFADKFAQNFFQEVIINEEFLLLPSSQLIEILSSDDLNIRNEEQVFKAVMAWVQYNVADRKQYLYKVLQHVRLPLMKAKFLVGTVGIHPLIRGEPTCRDLVDEAKDYLLLPLERPALQTTRTRHRRSANRSQVLYVAGGWCNGDAIASLERFDSETGDWKMGAPMHKRRCGVGVAALRGLLYAVGGHDGQSYLDSVERYDPETNSWACDVAPTSTCRTSVGVAVLDNFLYAVGGQDGMSCLNIVERYNPVTNKWTRVASMKTRRLGVAVAVLGHYLYAVGGADGTSPLNTVERYDAISNRWTSVSGMRHRRKHLGAACYKGYVYAVGGRDDTRELDSVERYDPRTDTWTPLPDMNSRRSGVGLAVVNGSLVAVGGFDGATYLKSAEVFDLALEAWRAFGSMNFRRLGGGVGVIDPTDTALAFPLELSVSSQSAPILLYETECDNREIKVDRCGCLRFHIHPPEHVSCHTDTSYGMVNNVGDVTSRNEVTIGYSDKMTNIVCIDRSKVTTEHNIFDYDRVRQDYHPCKRNVSHKNGFDSYVNNSYSDNIDSDNILDSCRMINYAKIEDMTENEDEINGGVEPDHLITPIMSSSYFPYPKNPKL